MCSVVVYAGNESYGVKSLAGWLSPWIRFGWWLLTTFSVPWMAAVKHWPFANRPKKQPDIFFLKKTWEIAFRRQLCRAPAWLRGNRNANQKPQINMEVNIYRSTFCKLKNMAHDRPRSRKKKIDYQKSIIFRHLLFSRKIGPDCTLL